MNLQTTIDWPKIADTSHLPTTSSIEEKEINIYYQWEPGAYSHEVAQELLPYIEVLNEADDLPIDVKSVRSKVRYKIWKIIWLETFEQVHQMIENWHIWILPTANSTKGAVPKNTNYILGREDIVVHGGKYQPIQHGLHVCPGDTIVSDDKDHPRTVEIVWTHWQAYWQSNIQAERLWLKFIDMWDTAGAARWVADMSGIKYDLETWRIDTSQVNPIWMAVICSNTAAKMYGLLTVDPNVWNTETNRTKFAVITHKDTPIAYTETPNRTILKLHVTDEAGSLNSFGNISSMFRMNATEIHSSILEWTNGDLKFEILLEHTWTLDEENNRLAAMAMWDRRIRGALNNPKIKYLLRYLWNERKYDWLSIIWNGNREKALKMLVHPQVIELVESAPIWKSPAQTKSWMQQFLIDIRDIALTQEIEKWQDVSHIWWYRYEWIEWEEFNSEVEEMLPQEPQLKFPEGFETSADNTIIELHVSQKAGSLNEFLWVLTMFGVNATQIHSVIVPGNTHDISYNIYLKLQWNKQEPHIHSALLAVSHRKIRESISHPVMEQIATYMWNGDKLIWLKKLWEKSYGERGNDRDYLMHVLWAISHPKIQEFLISQDMQYFSENMDIMSQVLILLVKEINGHAPVMEAIGWDISVL